MLSQPDAVTKRIAAGLGRLALALKAKAWRSAVDEGITPTQGEVLARLADTPAGTGLSDLARQLGAPGASRAVGMANNKNPVAIIVPCHRVVGADGSLNGYAGGLDRKRQLLDLESGVNALL